MLIVGLVFLLSAISTWLFPSQELQEINSKLQEAESKVNVALNELVDMCIGSLPEGIPNCDLGLRDEVRKSCEKNNNKFEACNDGRVDEYYKSRSLYLEPKTTDLSQQNENQESLAATSASDIFENINQKIEQPTPTQKLNRTCLPDRVCVKPGDYLQYSYETPQVKDEKGVLTYYFKDYLDNENITVQLVYVSDEGNKFEEIRTMNLITGLLDKKPKDLGESLNRVPHTLFSVSPTQLTYENLNEVKITEKKFGAWHGKGDRDTIFVESEQYGTDWAVRVFIDKETRVVIFSSHYTYGGYLVILNVLRDTNIFSNE